MLLVHKQGPISGYFGIRLSSDLSARLLKEMRVCISKFSAGILHPIFLSNFQSCVINEQGWTDFYPVVLPTEEKVAAMLKGTRHKPEEIVGRMFPASPHEAWEYNVEQVAVNAVMAGAIQAYQPGNMYYTTTASIDEWR